MVSLSGALASCAYFSYSENGYGTLISVRMMNFMLMENQLKNVLCILFSLKPLSSCRFSTSSMLDAFNQRDLMYSQIFSQTSSSSLLLLLLSVVLSSLCNMLAK
jgi:hypothetical protein